MSKTEPTGVSAAFCKHYRLLTKCAECLLRRLEAACIDRDRLREELAESRKVARINSKTAENQLQRADAAEARAGHRFIEAAEELAAKVATIRGKSGRQYIRQLDGGAFGGPIGVLLDELDAAYARWLKGEPGGRL